MFCWELSVESCDVVLHEWFALGNSQKEGKSDLLPLHQMLKFSMASQPDHLCTNHQSQKDFIITYVNYGRYNPVYTVQYF
jgi:hypothetical protein